MGSNPTLGTTILCDAMSFETRITKAQLRRMNYAGRDMSNYHIVDSTLTDIDFTGTKLCKSMFWGVRIHDTTFDGADIRGCCFAFSTLKDVSMKNITIDDATKFIDTVVNDILFPLNTTIKAAETVRKFFILDYNVRVYNDD